MSNLTITVDDELLRRARIRALERGTSVNALLRAYLEAFVSEDSPRVARKRIAALAVKSKARSDRRIKRDELYDR